MYSICVKKVCQNTFSIEVWGGGAEEQRYKPESRCFDSRWGHQEVHCSNPAGRTNPWGRLRGIYWRQRLTADNFTIFMFWLHWPTNFCWLCASEVIIAISYSFRGAEHEYGKENPKLATVSKKSANVYFTFKQFVHQTCNDKSPLLLATSLCL
jgi:hypothetical protein